MYLNQEEGMMTRETLEETTEGLGTTEGEITQDKTVEEMVDMIGTDKPVE